MRYFKLITAAMVAALAVGCNSSVEVREGIADSKNADGTPKKAAFGGFIVRNIHYFTTPAKNLDLAAKSCMADTKEWKAADSRGRENLMKIGRNKVRKMSNAGYVQYFIGRHGLARNHYASVYAPKGMFLVGEEVTLKLVPKERTLVGKLCPNPGLKYGVKSIDGIFRCDTGSLLGSSDRGVRCKNRPRSRAYPIYTGSNGLL